MKKTVLFSAYYENGEGKIVSPRFHDDAMEIVEITSGKVRVQIGTDIATGEAGDIFFVPQGLVYGVESLDGSYASLRGISFSTYLIENAMDNFDSELLYMFYVQSKNRITPFKQGHPVHSQLSHYINEACDEFADKDVCYNLHVRADLYLIFTSLLRFYCGSKNEQDRMVYHNVLRLRSVIDYIDLHYGEKTYIEKLSGMIMVSPDYFTKMFRDSVGKTPIDYINAIRINFALRLLVSTDLSMSDIAEKVGFSNANYFHKIFKMQMGQSPLSYRKYAKM